VYDPYEPPVFLLFILQHRFKFLNVSFQFCQSTSVWSECALLYIYSLYALIFPPVLCFRFLLGRKTDVFENVVTWFMQFDGIRHENITVINIQGAPITSQNKKGRLYAGNYAENMHINIHSTALFS